LFSSWYEFFPRSQGASYDADTDTWTSGTFDSSHERLEAAAAMGFDVVYIPPIHPIGTSFRKGPNNTLDLGPADPGSPWAIGNVDGGHDAIHPTWATSTRSTVSWPGPTSWGWRSRWTSRCRPRPTTPG